MNCNARRAVFASTWDARAPTASRTRIASPRTGEPLDREEWIAYRKSVGRPDWSIEAGISYYDGVRAGEADVVTDDYRALTGKKPRSIRELIALHREEMPLARGSSSSPRR